MGLREFADTKTADELSWEYPQVRMDLIQIKDNHAHELYAVEGKLINMTAANDSLEVALIISESKHSAWYDNLELGIIAGAVLAIFTGWSMGQVK